MRRPPRLWRLCSARSARTHNRFQPRLALISFYLRTKDSAAALSTAQEAAAALRNEPRILGALAQAHEAAGETNQAIETLNRWATLEPASATPLVRLAAMSAKRQDYSKAIDLLRKAQKLAPDDLGITRDLVVGYLLAGKPDEAIKEAKSLQSTRAAGCRWFRARR